MTRAFSVALLLAGLALAYLWHRAEVRAGIAGALADARADSLTAARDSLNVKQAERLLRDRADSLTSARLAASLAGQRVALARTRDSAARLTAELDSLRALPPAAGDTARILAAALTAVAVLGTEGAACRAAGASLDSLLGVCEGRRLRADSTNRDLQALLLSTEALLATERRRASPGPLVRARQALPYMAAAAILTMILAKR